MIDVSQAVEHDHPHALEFLRKDATNITGNKLMMQLKIKQLIFFIGWCYVKAHKSTTIFYMKNKYEITNNFSVCGGGSLPLIQ